MTIEDRVAYLEALLVNLHRLSRGLGVETVFNHPASLNVGTKQQIALRGEAGDGGLAAPLPGEGPFLWTAGVYGTSETANDVENCGVIGVATQGRVNSAIKGRYQRVTAESAGLIAEEVAGDAASTTLTRVRISPFGFVAEGVANPLPSFALTASGFGFWWEGGHCYWIRPDGSRSLVQGT